MNAVCCKQIKSYVTTTCTSRFSLSSTIGFLWLSLPPEYNYCDAGSLSEPISGSEDIIRKIRLPYIVLLRSGTLWGHLAKSRTNNLFLTEEVFQYIISSSVSATLQKRQGAGLPKISRSMFRRTYRWRARLQRVVYSLAQRLRAQVP